MGERGARVLASAALLAAAIASAAPARAGAAVPCGTMVLPVGVGQSVPAVVSTLQPLLVTSQPDVDLASLLYPPLVVMGPGESGSGAIDWTDSPAASVSADATRTVFTVTLHPWHWSDGEPVTSADVLYTWHLIQTLGLRWSNYGNGGVPTLIRSVTAPDPRTVVFRLTSPVNPDWFIDDGLAGFNPLPVHLWGDIPIQQQEDREDRPAFYGAVDGPFRIAAFRPGRDVTLVPNPGFGGHRASLARLVVLFTAGSDPLEAFSAGTVDMVTMPPDLASAAARLPDSHVETLGQSPEFPSLIPNLASGRDPFFADPRVRVAMARAIDQERIIRTVFHGAAVEQHGFVPATWTALVPPSLQAGHAAKSGLGYDPGAARHLLDEAGWVPGPDGVRQRRGVPLAFTLDVIAAGTDPMEAQLIQDDLAHVGIAMRIHEIAFEPFLVVVAGPARNWDAALMPQPSSVYPDGTVAFVDGNQNDYGHYTDPTLSRLLAEADRNDGTDALFAAERLVASTQPMIFLPSPLETVLVRNDVEGVHRFLEPDVNWLAQYLTDSRLAGCPSHD